MLSEAINKHARERLRTMGITDDDLLAYLLDREWGLPHGVAIERLFSNKDPNESERCFIDEILKSLPPRKV